MRLDVGQADAILVEFPCAPMLVDNIPDVKKDQPVYAIMPPKLDTGPKKDGKKSPPDL